MECHLLPPVYQAMGEWLETHPQALATILAKAMQAAKVSRKDTCDPNHAQGTANP